MHPDSIRFNETSVGLVEASSITGSGWDLMKLVTSAWSAFD